MPRRVQACGQRKNTRFWRLPRWLSGTCGSTAAGWCRSPSGSARFEWEVVTAGAHHAEWLMRWRSGCAPRSSGSIVLVRTGWPGIGAGQQNRVESGEIAAKKAAGRAQGGACASDAFYPFPDGIEAAAAAGVSVIVQPGGAMRDEPNIERADELGVAMVFTGERHFLHDTTPDR
jgi:phosphoribosylaminoimidazolecarboxamide formyltransferase/IMP cyclohydrolase